MLSTIQEILLTNVSQWLRNKQIRVPITDLYRFLYTSQRVVVDPISLSFVTETRKLVFLPDSDKLRNPVLTAMVSGDNNSVRLLSNVHCYQHITNPNEIPTLLKAGNYYLCLDFDNQRDAKILSVLLEKFDRTTKEEVTKTFGQPSNDKVSLSLCLLQLVAYYVTKINTNAYLETSFHSCTTAKKEASEIYGHTFRVLATSIQPRVFLTKLDYQVEITEKLFLLERFIGKKNLQYLCKEIHDELKRNLVYLQTYDLTDVLLRFKVSYVSKQYFHENLLKELGRNYLVTRVENTEFETWSIAKV